MNEILTHFDPTLGLHTSNLSNTVLLDDLCLSIDPTSYFRMLHSFSLDTVGSSSSSILSAIPLLADSLLLLQRREPGQRVCFSANDGGPPIVIGLGASYSISPFIEDFLPDLFIPEHSSIQ